MRNRKRYRNLVGLITIVLTLYLFLGRTDMKMVSATQEGFQRPEVILTCEDEDGKDENAIICKVKVSNPDTEWFKIHIVVSRMNVNGVRETTRLEDIVFEEGVEKELIFDEEGVYKVYAEIIDRFGNAIQTDALEFVIDRTDPLLSMELSQVNEESIYNTISKGLTIVLRAKDLSLIKERCEVKIRQDGEEWEKISYDSVSGTNTMTITVNFDETTPEGKYEIALSAMDELGKEAEKSFAFVIDNTAMIIDNLQINYEKETMENPNRFFHNEKEIVYFNDTVKVCAEITEKNYSHAKVFVNTIRNGILVDEKNIDMESEKKKISITYSEEGNYETAIVGKDAAGNESTPQSVYYVIDKTAPEFKLTQMVRDEESEMGENQLLTVNEHRAFRFYFIDSNQNRKTYQVRIESRENMQEKPMITTLKGNEIEWMQGEDASEIYFEIGELFKKEAFYTVTLSGTDLAGNEGVKKKISFCVDSTAPFITNLRYFSEDGVLKQKYDTIFSRKAVRMEFTVKDLGVGVEDKNVYVTVGSEETAGAKRYKAHELDEDTYYIEIPSDLKVSEFNDVLTIWASDKLENERKVLSSRIIYRVEKPRIRMESNEDYGKWTNQNITFATTVEDNVSGLKEVVYKANEKTIKKVTFDKPVYRFSYDVVATEEASGSDGYSVVVEVINNNGVTNTAKRQVYIDKTKPFVELTGVENLKHYKMNQKITANVKDVSYEGAETIYYVERTWDGKTTRVSTTAYISKYMEEQFLCEIKKQGEYKVYAVTTDCAGNRRKSNSLSFVIDKEAPELSIDGIENKKVQNKAVTLKFTCVESFFETNNVKIEVERTLEGDTIVSEEKKISCNAKKSILEKCFSEDGIYKVTISATDQAGNVAQAKSIHFTVDKTSPKIQIRGCEEYQLWSKPVWIEWVIEESFYQGNKVELSGTRKNIDGTIESLEMPGMTNHGRVSTLKQIFREDGIYELEMSSQDEAGNRECKSIHFTIDQTCPEINHFEKYDGKYYQVFKMTDSMEKMVKDLTVISYRILLNGVEYNGVDEVTREGKYDLSLDVVDELGHKSRKAIAFIVDHTPPRIIFRGVKDGEAVKETGKVSLELMDEEDVITGIRMNEVEYETDTRELAYSEYGTYHIEVDCVDKAGNQITHDLHFVYTNPVVKVYIIIGILFSVSILCVLFGRKLRNS